MRKVIPYLLSTLDGYIGGPNGELDFFEPGPNEMVFANTIFASTDTVLLGRNDYQGFVEYWDALDITDPAVAAHDIRFVEIFRNQRRVVFSRTLESVPENATIIRDNIPEAIRAMKAEPGGDMLLIAGPELLTVFFENDLIDEFVTILCPITIGNGKRLFPTTDRRTEFDLVYSEVFPSGAVALRYVLKQ